MAARRRDIPADTSRIDTVTPPRFVRDIVTHTTIGQITGMQLGEQSKPRRVEQAISDLERVEQTETRIIIQSADIDACQLSQPGQRRHSLARRREHRLPEPVDPYRTPTTGYPVITRGCLIPIPSRTHVRSLPHPCDTHPDRSSSFKARCGHRRRGRQRAIIDVRAEEEILGFGPDGLPT